jgi:hypothetical protein
LLVGDSLDLKSAGVGKVSAKFDPDDVSALELLRIVPLDEAVYLSGMTAEDLQQRFPDKIIEIGENGLGMRALDALRLTEAPRD